MSKEAQTKRTHVTAHIRKAARTRIDIQKRLPAFQPSYHPHPTKWYGPSQTTCFTTTGTDISSKGTRSIWSQEAKEEVVQGQGYARLLYPIHAHTIHIPESHRNHEPSINLNTPHLGAVSLYTPNHENTLPNIALWNRKKEQFR